jgi:hypothetical protein
MVGKTDAKPVWWDRLFQVSLNNRQEDRFAFIFRFYTGKVIYPTNGQSVFRDVSCEKLWLPVKINVSIIYSFVHESKINHWGRHGSSSL